MDEVVALDLNISETPHKTAQKIFQHFIQPFLHQKAEHCGNESARQTFVDLVYLFMLSEISFNGEDGIENLQRLIDDAASDVAAYKNLNGEENAVNESDFFSPTTKTN